MEYFQKYTILQRISERIRKEKLEMQLLVAEAINYAYIGSQPPTKKGQTPAGARAYKRWQRKKQREMYPELKRKTLWDGLVRDKKRKSFKIN